MGKQIRVFKVVEGVTIAAGGSYTSKPIILGQIEGFFSIQTHISGDGTVQIDYEASNDGENFMVPEGASAIDSELTKTSGPGANGKSIIDFGPIPCKGIRIKITETGTSDSVTVSAYLVIQ